MRVETVILAPDTAQYAGEGQRGPNLEAIAASARRLEELGFDTITAPEAGHDPFLPLAIAAEHTERARLATNVAIAFPRSPMVTAQLAWDLQQLSGGRFALGLGTQVKGHVERRYAARWTGPPGPRLREYVQCVRAMFESFQKGGRPQGFQGEHYRFDLMSPFFNPGPLEHPPVPIQTAAVNPFMARLAGELCEGLRLHPIATASYTRNVVRPAVAAGAARAGRTASDVELVGAPFIATGPDQASVAEAKQALKQHIAFYASTRTYHAVLEHHGWQDVGLELHRLSREGEWKQMAAQIRDDMLDAWAISGTWDEIGEKLAENVRDLYSSVLLDLPPALRAQDARVRAIIDTLHGV